MNSPVPCLRVLIVDDARSLRGLLRTLLSQNGYEVVGDLNDGSHVLETVERDRPDLICLDLNMPKVDGMTVLRDLKVSYPEVAVVMMTGDTSPAVYREATELGAAGFLQKPFSPEQILDELGHAATALRLLRQGTGAGADTVPDFVAEPSGRVVIADDSVAQRHLLRAILENMGLEVAGEAGDGQQAIDIALREKPDVVCLDVEMPILDGLSALAKLRTLAPALPVMMITSHSDRETVQQAARAGAKGYIVKPYQPGKVELAIRKLLNL